MAKHSTKTAQEFRDQHVPSTVELPPSAVPEGYENLPTLTEDLNLTGWIRPAVNMHVFGRLITTVKRREPGARQAEKFHVIELAVPLVGLLLTEDREAEASETMLEVGSRVGLDMRQGTSKLDGKTGKVHIHFIEKLELDNGPWWKTKIDGDLVEATPSNGSAASSAERIAEEDIPY